MIINVTQEDIENGQHGCSRCPIALAASRAYGRQVYVGTYNIYADYDGRNVLAKLPVNAVQFVSQFDTSMFDVLRPFSFEIKDN